jgi:DUF1680 family protein
MTVITKLTSLCLSVLLAQAPGFAQTTSVETFPLSAVRLMDGPFKQAQETDKRYMLSMEADRLLAPYVKEAGLPTNAVSYGNWENTGLDGHIGGHYLSALSLMYAATGDAVIKQRLDGMINKLAECQQANGGGYIGGIPGGKAMWKEVAAGKIDAGSFSLNGKWVPLYNIHKLFAGLYDAWTIAGNAKAKTLLLDLCNWCINLTAGLSDDQVQQMLRSEHGGLNEVFANVAAVTGDEKYLALARRFSDRRILTPLLQQKDALNGVHANTQIPKVIGYDRIGVVSKDTAWQNAALFFWKTVVQNRSVSIGGNSVREHFHPANDFSSMMESREGPETCNSYNMLKLTKGLFLSAPAVEYMDYYERTLYNHILSSQSPDGGFVYFTPMRPMHYRVYSTPQEGFWCCVGSGLENHGKYGELIYAHDKNDLYVNLFIPSTLDWKEKGLQLTQQTKFPAEDRTALTLTLSKPATFAIHLRYPSWVQAGQLKVWVNKKEAAFTKEKGSGYITIRRTWKKGDMISLQLPMHTEAAFLPDGSPWVSFVRGPIVLAAATDTTGLVGLHADGSRMGHIAAGPLEPLEEAPLVVAERNDLPAAIKQDNSSSFTFKAPALFYQDKYKDLTLRPFYTIHNSRYVIYFPYTSPENKDAVIKAITEKEKVALALETITADLVVSGEQQPESDHNMTGERTEAGYFKELHFRNAKGWFSYDLRNKDGKAKKLRLTYYGKEQKRDFDIYINEVLAASVKADGSRGDTFFTTDYAIPAEILAASPAIIKVKFVAKPGSATANVFEVRLLKE